MKGVIIGVGDSHHSRVERRGLVSRSERRGEWLDGEDGLEGTEGLEGKEGLDCEEASSPCNLLQIIQTVQYDLYTVRSSKNW